jgi:subtilase family serine protease
MRGMAIVGTRGMPGSPTQSIVLDFNALGNDFFNQEKYIEAIVEYNKALGITHIPPAKYKNMLQQTR